MRLWEESRVPFREAENSRFSRPTCVPTVFFAASKDSVKDVISLRARWELLRAAHIYSFPVAFPPSSIVRQKGMCTCVCYGEDREHYVQGVRGGKEQAASAHTHTDTHMHDSFRVTPSKHVVLYVLCVILWSALTLLAQRCEQKPQVGLEITQMGIR